MRDLLICRICLATDIKLFNIHQYKLVDSYEMLTQTKVSDCDRLPQHTCSYCSTLLLKSAQFKRKCNKTQDLLKYSITQQEMPAFEYLNTIDRIHHNLVLPYKTVTINKEDITVSISLDCKIKDEIADWSDIDEEPLDITKKLYNKGNNDDNVDDFDMSVKMEDCLNEQSPIDQDNIGLFETNTEFHTESKEYEILDSDNDTQVIQSPIDQDNIGLFETITEFDTESKEYEILDSDSDTQAIVLNKDEQFINSGHLRAHTEERPFKCPDCPKAFTFAFLLRKHRLVHVPKQTGDRPFRCTDYPKAFTVASLLRKHRLEHPRKQTGELPFRCTECPKAFSFMSGLKRHSWVHTGYKPYGCQVCEKRFTHYRSCKLHYSTVHLKKPSPYKQKSLAKKPKIVFDDETNVYEDVESGETNESDVVGVEIEINKCEKDKKDQVTKYEIVDPKFEKDEYEDSKANDQRYLSKVKIEDEDVTFKEEDVDHHNYMAENATCIGTAKDSNVRNVFLDKDHVKQINVIENEVVLGNRRSPPKRTYSGKLKKSKEVLLNNGNAMKSLKDDKLFSLNKLNNDVAIKIEEPEEMETVKAAQRNVVLIKTEKKDQKKIILNESL